MIHLALTQPTASWILGKAGMIDALHDALVTCADSPLQPGEDFVEGPFRIATSASGIVAMWNIDYLSGTGDEPWGFIRLHGSNGLSKRLDLSREVFERCIYVISQRLQGFNLSGTLFPRAYANGAHTCLAGRGTDARQVSIGYFETHIGDERLRQQAIVCVGPEQNWRVLEDATVAGGAELPALVRDANQLISPGRQVALTKPEILTSIRDHLAPFTRDTRTKSDDVEVVVEATDISHQDRHSAFGRTYDDWLRPDSSLSHTQRRILEGDGIDRHPLRILGPGGSGKTLLLQLLALRRLRAAAQRREAVRILYVVHNHAMSEMIKQRFDILMSDNLLASPSDTLLEVKTLSRIAREHLELEDAHVIDVDAQEAKEFQFESVCKAFQRVMDLDQQTTQESPLFRVAQHDDRVFNLAAMLIMTDISVAIKGHGLERDRRRYVESARNLSRFHGALKEAERGLVFSVFEEYHKDVFENLEVLDSDDLALSLLGRLRTPIWQLRRRQLGYDFVFVDETQLFNENERRIVPLLTNGARDFVPVVIALDEAQAVYGQSAAGFAALGIEGIANENLGSIHRSTKAIVDLAFFVIQRSTDLFGPDFPNFTEIAERLQPSNHALAAKPRIEIAQDEKQGVGKFVLKRVRDLRRANLRQICVIVHADQYWGSVNSALKQSDLPFQQLLTRGERLPHDQPLVVISKPAYIGGQEFDAVVLVGLEQGIVPPRFSDNEALSSAVEQQALREIYLSVTRARFQVIVAVSQGAAVTGVLAEAAHQGLLDHGRGQVIGRVDLESRKDG